jgi:RNA polymerase sigma-70 factor (ECF subfamily)
MPQTTLVGIEIPATPAETALALKLVGKTDLLRLKTIARLHARGLPGDIGWADLLQEAFARVLDGSQRQPDGLPMIAFLAGVMRSLKAEHWRRLLREAGSWQTIRIGQASDAARDVEPPDPAPDPERALMAVQELAGIDRLFALDVVALLIIEGLGEGLSADQIRAGAGLSKTEYDSARRRIRRILLREGLTCRRS